MTQTAKPVEFKVGEETFSLKLGFSAVCRMEEEFDMGFLRIVQEVFGGEMRMAQLLTVFHACMLRDAGSVADEDVTRAEAADIIDKLGVDKVADLIRRAIEASPLSATKPGKRVRGAGTQAG